MANQPPTETLLAMHRIALRHYKKTSLIALFILSACTTGAGPEVGLLDTTIKGDDIRLFRYTLPLFREKQRPRAGGGQNRNNDRAEGEGEEAQLKRADYFLSEHPRLKEYCPNGYTVIDKYAVLNEIIIRGECKYSAE